MLKLVEPDGMNNMLQMAMCSSTGTVFVTFSLENTD